MIKCPNCGTENEDNNNFCENCVAKLPHEKECPNCHAKVKLTAKFCTECAYNFATSSNTNTAATGFSVGDKNVIAGDVIGKQETFKIAGAATIVKNEDETKKMVKCHVCGHNITILQSIDCPVCHEIICDNCYDSDANRCLPCAEKTRENNEKTYLQALKKAYEDKKITSEERQVLDKLKSELNIPDNRASELELQVKKESFSAGSASRLTFFEQKTFEKSMSLLYDDGNAQQAYDRLKPIFKKNPHNGEILSVFLDAALLIDPNEVLQIIRQNQSDEIGIYLAGIDYFLMNHDLYSADERLNTALTLWPEDLLLNCRKALCLKAMYDELQDTSLLQQAMETLSSIGEPQNKLENSWLIKTQFLIEKAMGKKTSELNKKYCREHNLYHALCSDFSQNAGYVENGVEHQFPDGITEIESEAFLGNTSLTSVVIPDSVEKIGESAFEGCTSLTSVVIPDSVTTIEDNAFRECTSLTSVVIPDSVTEIGENAFSECTSLTSVVIPDSVTEIGDEAFSGCTSLTSVVIPDCVTEIEEAAFRGCTSLTSVEIPDSVTKIGVEAFNDCTSLTNVVIPDSVTEIGENAFSECTSLTSVVIPDSVTEIGDEAFSGCIGLQKPLIWKGTLLCWGNPKGKIVIPGSVKKIGACAFYQCFDLTSVVIPESVTEIGERAFCFSEGLTKIVIPGSVTKIGEYAFASCSGLTDVVIPPSVKTVADNAFEDCSAAVKASVKRWEKASSPKQCDFVLREKRGDNWRDDVPHEKKGDNWRDDVLHEKKGGERIDIPTEEKSDKDDSFDLSDLFDDSLKKCIPRDTVRNPSISEIEGHSLKLRIPSSFIPQSEKETESSKSPAEIYQLALSNKERDKDLYMKQLRNAAEAGYAPAQYDMMAEQPERNDEEKKIATSWCIKAAEQGYAKAQATLGCRFEYGKGVELDKNEAVKWYRKAAEQGYALGQVYLAQSYMKGSGVLQDKEAGHQWYLKAAEQGQPNAQEAVSADYAMGRGVSKDCSEAVKWARKAAEKNHKNSQYQLGMYYANGNGVPQNYEEAIKWITKAAEQGYALAQYTLGDAYYNCKMGLNDTDIAKKWLMKSAEQGYATAMFELGFAYMIGSWNLPKDYIQGEKWLIKAAEAGNKDAQYQLAKFYEDGDCLKKDLDQAKKWYKKASEQGSGAASFQLASLYLPNDKNEAYKWICIAAEQGNPYAKRVIEKRKKS